LRAGCGACGRGRRLSLVRAPEPVRRGRQRAAYVDGGRAVVDDRCQCPARCARSRRGHLMKENKLQVHARLEQFRQARRIHGGTINLCAASLGVKLSRIPIPSRWLRERVYRTVYGKKYKSLNEAELDRPLGEFRSLNDLFTRGVRAEYRPIPDTHAQLL